MKKILFIICLIAGLTPAFAQYGLCSKIVPVKDNVYANITTGGGSVFMVGGWSVCYIENQTLLSFFKTGCYNSGTGYSSGSYVSAAWAWTEWCGLASVGLYFHNTGYASASFGVSCCSGVGF